MNLERTVKREKRTRNRALKIALRVFIILIIIAVVGMFGGTYYAICQLADHRVEKLEAVPEDFGLASETISTTSADGTPIMAWLIPNKSSRGIILVLHGMDGMDASSLLGISKFLYDSGYTPVAVDMRAHGRSGGSSLTFAYHEPEDVGAVLDWLEGKEEYKDLPIGILGFSMGGATAIRTAAARLDVDAVVSLSSYASIEEMSADFMASMGAPDILTAISAPFFKAAYALKFGVIPSTSSPVHDIKNIGSRPILIAHGTADDQTAVKHAYELYEASGKTAELWIEQGAGHCIFKGDGTGPEDEAYRQRILEFFNKSLK